MAKPSLKKDPVKYWFSKIDREKKAHDKYRKDGKESADAARDDGSAKHAFNIHWANCKIVKSAIYAKRPKPDVRRRYQKPNPEEKELARLVERAIEFSMDTKSFETPSMAVVKDFVVSAMGVPRVIYDVNTTPMPDVIEDSLQVTEPAFDQGLEEIAAQSVGIEHIPWKHFHWEPGHSDWNNVGWIAIEFYQSREKAEREYGVDLKSGEADQEGHREAEKYEDQIQLFEVFHKPSRRVYVITRGHDEPLRDVEDKLNLQGFYPVPRPAFDNLKSDELIPKPDYQFIKHQVIELNRLTQRRSNLVKHIKAVRIYDSKAADIISALENATDGANIPVTNMVEILESAGGSAGFERIIAELPMADRVAVVRELDIQAESTKQQIYEIIGIGDIIRGSTQASETATAQQLKGQWANVRLNDKTSEVNRLWRDVLRMMAEVICEHFDPRQLFMMTGIEVTPGMQEMMQSDIGRSFAIDVETDSTILRDDQEERQQKLELVNILLEKLSFVLPLVQQGTLPVEMVQEILLFIVSSHKHGKQLEDSIQGLGEQMGNLQNLQQLQQQLQQSQMQIQQLTQQGHEAVQQIKEQAGQQIQQLQGELGKVNQRKESREDAKVQIEQRKVGIMGADKQSESGLDKAKTDEIYHGMKMDVINEQNNVFRD